VAIPLTVTKADIDGDTLRKLLFRDTLASCSTKLSNNSKRTTNVRLASEAINGLVLNPGDEFSYNDVVGKRTAQRGYQIATAYSSGEVVESLGGGICQVSSTLYMAVLRADLEVTNRVNHGLTVSYTPLGEDATVSWGGPEFKFKNDTDYPVKILTRVENGKMVAEILGTNLTGKTVTIETNVLSTTPFTTIEKKDPTLPAGQTKVEKSGYTGYSTETFKVITENGKTTRVKANTSTYKKVDKVVLVGTGESTTTPDAKATTPATASTDTQSASTTTTGSTTSSDPEAT
jgi:vancomycin resistance protein YoaR